MRGLFLFFMVGVLLPTHPSMALGQNQTAAEAQDRLRRGDYQEGLRAFRTLAEASNASVSVVRSYARGLMEVGRYDEAIGILVDGGSGAELANVLGEALYTVGRLQEAESAFQQAADQGASDGDVARLNLGVLWWNQGKRDEALAIFDSFIDLYNQSRTRLSAESLMAVGTAVKYLGITNSALFQDALMAFDEAAEISSGDPRPDLLAGELFLEKYKATDARESFRPVLERNPRNPRALLGQARILDFEGVGGSVGLVEEALDVNPHYVPARAFLASLFIKTENYDQARQEAERALETNPVHLQALSVLAATHFLEGDQAAYEEVRGRVLSLNPNYPDLYTMVAEAAVTQRQYQTAVDLAQEAVVLDPTSWWSYGVLGMNQLRTGAVEEGRTNLESAFEGDPYNPWYKNSLDLLDTFVHFQEVTTEHFRIFVHEREAELLGPYAAGFAEEAFSALQDRYGTTPPVPIRLEIYPNHSDFSVRTLGLTGLGALGVSFGSTLVMDSPSALDPGDFNWASTMWHEIAHAFHLAMSDHKVPRWFTEGLAVHEQHKARIGWGYKATPAWLQAYDSGKLHPVSRLNEGFIRPEFPEQVVFSYYQASLVFDLIERDWGVDGILAMLEGYRLGRSNEEVFQGVLGQSPGDFDEVFDDFVQDRWGTQMASVSSVGQPLAFTGAPPPNQDLDTLRRLSIQAPGSFQARLSFGQALFEAGEFEEAEGEFRAALALFPEYGGPNGPYRYLSGIHRQKGEAERSARALQQMGFLNEALFQVHLEEAEIWQELEDGDAAAEALEKAVEIVPFEAELHARLAGLYEEMGDHEGAVRERRAVLALGPTDRADAHYRLAAAMAAAGDRAGARTQVLRALEIAPSFEAALELLLELRGGSGAGSGVGGGAGVGAEVWNEGDMWEGRI